MSQNLAKLESLLGYRFQNLKLLERAVTHRSWAYEKFFDEPDEIVRGKQNESLEFVGDSVLGLAIAEHLYLNHPNSTEGDLTLMKHHLVSTGTLAKTAQNLELGNFIRVGRGEEKTGGRKKLALLADMLEAIIGAVFFDTGYTAARNLVGKLFAEELCRASPETSIDYKTLLQETLQADKLTAPTYTVIKTEGPPHERVFFVEAAWETGVVFGEGNSIKSAEMAAASTALELLKKGKS